MEKPPWKSLLEMAASYSIISREVYIYEYKL